MHACRTPPDRLSHRPIHRHNFKLRENVNLIYEEELSARAKRFDCLKCCCLPLALRKWYSRVLQLPREESLRRRRRRWQAERAWTELCRREFSEKVANGKTFLHPLWMKPRSIHSFNERFCLMALRCFTTQHVNFRLWCNVENFAVQVWRRTSVSNFPNGFIESSNSAFRRKFLLLMFILITWLKLFGTHCITIFQ